MSVYGLCRRRQCCSWKKNMMLLPMLSLVWMILMTTTTTSGVVGGTTTTTTTTDYDDLMTRLIGWLREGGGKFHSSLEIRREDPSDPTSRYGMYANADIAEDELLLLVQRHQLLTEGKFKNELKWFEDGTIWCPTAYNLIYQMRELGPQDSKFGPYIEYLLLQEEGQLPSHWSEGGKRLLLELLAQDNNYDHSHSGHRDDLRPAYPVEYVSEDWIQTCRGSSTDRFAQHAGLMLLQRGWDDIMIPVYDMMSHRNGKQWLNTKSNSVHDVEEPVVVRASKDIKKGDEINTSYNHCTDCGNRVETAYGTPELLRDFGFVENYPQRWNLGKNIKFDLDFDDSNNDGQLQVTWLHNKKRPSNKSIYWIKLQLERLQYFQIDDDDDETTAEAYLIPKYELSTIRRYRDAVVTALTEVLKDLGHEPLQDCSISSSTSSSSSSKEGEEGTPESCAISYRYDDLSFVVDEVDYNVDTCNTDISLNFENFTKIDKPNSQYQTIFYNKQHEPDNDNVCFSLHNIWQMCGSYRPHYHEMVVHYTARYLPDIKRVAFVGGGDSMLLHEILKYPSLELVIGLELDQMVTRSAFKHFGTQPHFDQSPKVQWWFGDASKTLLMLPQSYFGSFDMILVDLSETVMSLSVTDGLDIFSALSLLMKPEGIFVKNELYMEQMSDIFEYALQIHYSDVPVICSQCLIFGSNKVDFSKRVLTDHGIDDANLYLQPIQNIPDPYEYWHDFRHNASASDICRHDFETIPPIQTASPGIAVILEAENVKSDVLSYPPVLAEDIITALEGVWKNIKWIVRTIPSEDETEIFTPHGSIITLIFQQGYIQLLTFPKAKYCAIDMHVWGGFQKTQDQIQDIVLKAIKSDTYQSYRIVAGGIFGLDSWREDAANLGPRLPEHCHQKENDADAADEKKEDDSSTTESSSGSSSSSSSSTDDDKSLQSYANSMLQETLETIVLTSKDAVITVLCGAAEEECAYVTLLQTLGYTNVIPLYACPNVTNEYAQDAVEQMKNCEKTVYLKLREGTTTTTTNEDEEDKDDLIRAIILDRSTTYIFGRIVYKVLKTYKSRWFHQAHELLAFSIIDTDDTSTDDDQSWRRNLMERFRADVIVFEPNFATETVFDFGGDNNNKLEMGMTSSGDFRFTQKFVKAVSNLETQFGNGIIGDVRDLRGGLYLYYEDWKPDPYYLPQDYDQTSPYEQYKSQVPVGFQTLFQLGPPNDNVKGPLKTITTEQITASVRKAWITAANIEDKEIQLHSYTIGSGFVVSSSVMIPTATNTNTDAIIGGSCVVVFDGNLLLNVNLFTYDENRDVHANFIDTVMGGTKLEVKLRDVQPRGYGKVVSFRSDLDPKTKTNQKLPIIVGNDVDEKRALPPWVKFGDSPFKTESHTKSECSRERGCTLFE